MMVSGYNTVLMHSSTKLSLICRCVMIVKVCVILRMTFGVVVWCLINILSGCLLLKIIQKIFLLMTLKRPTATPEVFLKTIQTRMIITHLHLSSSYSLSSLILIFIKMSSSFFISLKHWLGHNSFLINFIFQV